MLGAMSQDDGGTDGPYGTAPHDAPVPRWEMERALRFLNLAITNVRDDVLRLAAQVVTLTDELTRRLDGQEPLPAAPGTPAAAPTGTVEDTVDQRTGTTLAKIQTADETSTGRVSLSPPIDKYEVTLDDPPPCMELLPLCGARCCQMTFSLTSQDLDEGIIRWDYGQPYLIRQRKSDGYCVHNHPGHHGCTVHAQRPATCRGYSCKQDKRIWIDFEKRIPAGEISQLPRPGNPPGSDQVTEFELHERARARQLALTIETSRVRTTFSDRDAAPGPALAPYRGVNDD
jgi:Putative zinc- or iron-chelating domain